MSALLVVTESGSVYLFKHEDGDFKVFRDGASKLDRDFEWVTLMSYPEIALGQPVFMTVDIGRIVTRHTSPVVAIKTVQVTA